VGQELAKIYDLVQKFAGSSGRIKFAKAVEASKAKASEIEDTAEQVDRYKKAAEQIIGKSIDELLSG
jgi:hypothetical protein